MDWIIPLAEALCTGPHQIQFITAEQHRSDIEAVLNKEIRKACSFTFHPDRQSFPAQYTKLRRTVAAFRPDILWVNTASARHLLFFLLKKKNPNIKLIVNIHEVNNSFKHGKIQSLHSWVRYISKKKLWSLTNAFVVNANAMKSYTEKRQFTTQPVFHIAPVYYKGPGHRSNHRFSIVIPGTVENKRRDYTTVIQAFNSFTKSCPDHNAELILAGKCTDESILPLLCRNTRISWFIHALSESEFQKIVAGASVLLSPQRIQTIGTDGLQETYGITKNSGNSYDAIRYAKPMIVPVDLNVPEPLDKFCITYTNETDLLCLFKNMMSGTVIDDLTKQAEGLCAPYTLQAFRERIFAMINSV